MVNDKSVPVTCLAGCRRVEEVARRRRSSQRSLWSAEVPATTPAGQICVSASVSCVCTKALKSGNPYLGLWRHAALCWNGATSRRTLALCRGE